MPWNPLISVIIPTFNRREIVTRAVASVLNQTYINLELLVIDDGSSDGTGEALSSFSSDPRFIYLYQTNSGQSAARNLGISEARGEYIALLDSDNYWLPEKLQKQVEYLAAHKSFEILYSEIIPITDKGGRLPRKKVARFSGCVLEQLLASNFITNNTVLVHKKCFQKLGLFDEQLRYAEDYDLWLRFATEFRFLYHPRDVACYCCDGDRLSCAEDKVIQANKLILSRFFSSFPDRVGWWTRRRAWSNLLKWEIESKWSSGHRPSSFDLLRLVSGNPFDWNSWQIVVRRVLG